MAWRRVNPKQQYGQTVTLRNNGGLAFSSTFIASNDLEEFAHVELFVDDDLRRVGFKFHREPTGRTNSLMKESEKGKVMGSTCLRNVPWIEQLLNSDLAERRFLVELDDSIESATSGVRFYISVGYHFEPKRSLADRADYPRNAGVYRLFKENAVVRIGETNCLERRLQEHFTRYSNQVDEYDFCKLEDASNRKTEEKRLLNEYQDAHGGLPKLNTISS